MKLGEAKGLLALITDYAKSFSLLNQFDVDEVPSDGLNGLITYEIDYTDAVLAIRQLKQTLIDKKEASEMFGKERSDDFQGILETIVQTPDSQHLYSTIEEQATNLLTSSSKIIRSAMVTNGLARLCLCGFWRKTNTTSVAAVC